MAQMQSTTTQGQTGGIGGNVIQDQESNTVDTFSNLKFQVVRVVKEPTKDAGFRVIMKVIEEDKAGRRVALIQPQATLVDEMGNIYGAVATSGVPVCTSGKGWDLDVYYCAQRAANTPVVLTPTQPINLVAIFVPQGDMFSPDLAALAKTGALQMRMAVYSKDLKTRHFTDIVINGLILPGGGS